MYTIKIAGITCIACMSQATEWHHIYTRKAHKEHTEKTWNLLPCCRKCHTEAHKLGRTSFANKHERVAAWMKNNGWVKNFLGKYWHE